MFTLNSCLVYQFYSKPCDMRKSFNGLSGLVRNHLGRDAHSGEVYIFLNRPANLIKLLHWEEGGFVLYYKRLEKGAFTRPILKEGTTSIQWPELVLMIAGIEVKNYSQKRRYKLKQ